MKSASSPMTTLFPNFCARNQPMISKDTPEDYRLLCQKLEKTESELYTAAYHGNGLLKSNNELKSRNALLEKQLLDVKMNIDDERRIWHENNESTRIFQEERINDLESHIASLDKMLRKEKEITRTVRDINERLVEDVRIHKNFIEEEKEIRSKTQKVAKEQLEELRREMASDKAQLEEQAKQLEHSRLEIKSLQLEAEKLQKTVDDLYATNNENETLLKKARIEFYELDQKLKDSISREEMDNQIQFLQEKLKDFKLKMDETVENNVLSETALKQEIADIDSQLIAAIEQKMHLSDELDQWKTDVEQIILQKIKKFTDAENKELEENGRTYFRFKKK